MPIAQPSSFPLSVGRDASISLVQDGTPVAGLCFTSFGSGQLEDGSWHGELSLDRTSQVLEELQAQDPVFWIIVNVKESDGSKTVYVYPEATLRFSGAGSWAPDSLVRQNIAFTAKCRTINGHLS